MAELPRPTDAAVVFADVVGYSRLMATDEVGTYARIVGLYHGVLTPAAERLGGDIGELRGDGALVTFAGPAGMHRAVQWADAAHAGAATTGTQAAPQLTLRIAIHMGEVLITDDGVFGDAVNLTARLQEHAPPGGTVLSEAVAQALRDTLDEPLVDLGRAADLWALLDLAARSTEHEVAAAAHDLVARMADTSTLSGGRPALDVVH